MKEKITNGKIRKYENRLWKYYQSSTLRSISVVKFDFIGRAIIPAMGLCG